MLTLLSAANAQILFSFAFGPRPLIVPHWELRPVYQNRSRMRFVFFRCSRTSVRRFLCPPGAP
jgi:hypothetical protein